MAVIANRIKGFADMYPPQSTLFTRMENTAREIFSRYGFVELRTPRAGIHRPVQALHR